MFRLPFKMSRKQRLQAIITISFVFFVAEISTGFYTHSLALIADAFHYLNDLISFIIALVAVHVSEQKTSPQDLSFGWARAQLLGAFFNGVFLCALGLSIFLQSIERFISIERIHQPKIVLIIGCIGLALNLVSAIFLHEHDHGHGHDHGHNVEHESYDDHREPVEHGTDANVIRQASSDRRARHASHKHTKIPTTKPHMDYGIAAVLIHVLGDALNNLGVIFAALIIWLTKSPARYYADPAVSMWIAIIVFTSAIPLTKKTAHILLQSAPTNVQLADIKHDLESIPGVSSIHELHVWRLDQRVAIATAHVVVNEDVGLDGFMKKVKTALECLHAYGIHSVTLQPELEARKESADVGSEPSTPGKCDFTCGTLCEPLMCCT